MESKRTPNGCVEEIDYRTARGLDNSAFRSLTQQSTWVGSHEDIFVLTNGRGKSHTRQEHGLAAEQRLRRGERTWRWAGPCSVRLQPQFGNSLNPRPLRTIGTHFSAGAALFFACFADETRKMYDFLQPCVSVANADPQRGQGPTPSLLVMTLRTDKKTPCLRTAGLTR